MQIVPPTEEGFETAAEALKAGGIVVYPAETVYGLGVDPFSHDALQRLYEYKGRDETNPVLLVIGEVSQLEAVVAATSPMAQAYIQAFWPGPLSMLFSASKKLPREVVSAEGRVCVRFTSCPEARRLCAEFGGAITSTSANRTGEAPAMCIEDVDQEGIAIGIDGGRLESGPPSTVFDPDKGEVLREGGITMAQLKAAGD